MFTVLLPLTLALLAAPATIIVGALKPAYAAPVGTAFAALAAYAPYSRFSVGCAIESVDGHAHVVLASGKQINTETVLYAVGRQGDTETLQLDKAGLEADSAAEFARAVELDPALATQAIEDDTTRDEMQREHAEVVQDLREVADGVRHG